MTWSFHIDARQGGPVYQHEGSGFGTVADVLEHVREGFDFERADAVEIWLEREGEDG